MENIKEEVFRAMTSLADTAKLNAGEIMVLGCSTSEIAGEHIGHGDGQRHGHKPHSGEQLKA